MKQMVLCAHEAGGGRGGGGGGAGGCAPELVSVAVDEMNTMSHRAGERGDQKSSHIGEGEPQRITTTTTEIVQGFAAERRARERNAGEGRGSGGGQRGGVHWKMY